jgi:secondary thiamine-phosphate synthase enzyme
MIDVTRQVAQAVNESGVQYGICTVFVPHTTAAVTINENADPDVTRDILDKLDRTFPRQDGYRHYEGNSASHIKASIFGFSETILVESGSLVLGTWQGIYFCEFDGPRTRNFIVDVK